MGLWAWLPPSMPGLQTGLELAQVWSWHVLCRDIPLRYMTAVRGASRAHIAETPEDGVASSHLPTSI